MMVGYHSRLDFMELGTQKNKIDEGAFFYLHSPQVFHDFRVLLKR
jgi:hypothetical protein